MDKRFKQIYDNAKAKKCRIVLPEGNDPRVVEAAAGIAKEGLAEPIVFSSKEAKKCPRLEEFSEEYYQLRKHKGITKNDAKKLLISKPVYLAAMMVRNRQADGFVAGASFTTRDVAKAAIQCIGLDRTYGIISSSFLMVFKDKNFGKDGILLFADCAIVPEPSAKQLAKIALASAELFNKLLSCKPKVAMLSYSSKGSGSGEAVEKVAEATSLAKKENPGLLIEGEMQADTAIVPAIAKKKWPESKIAGGANVLIFPDLNSGNVSYKLVQRLTGALALGPMLQGLNAPCSDLSRGCSVDEIVNTVAITAART